MYRRILAAASIVATLAIVLAVPAFAQQVVASGNLTPRPGQTARGTATATIVGSTISVTMRMTGLTANATHVNHIHDGQCEAEGGIAIPLADLRADAQGNATATTTATIPAGVQVTPGRHYFNVHAGPALPSPGISCGNVLLGALPVTGGGAAAGGLAVPAVLGGILAAVAGAGVWLRRRAR